MIRINRGLELEALADVRDTQLPKLRKLGRAPVSDDIDGYQVAADALWKAQHCKCCYCELRI